mmetsp:Transcript_10275/g.9081  ORF Transcript_10275/g.9081 Transcript_10275/m.9081 type:complete len:162 (+) Transcript_10275:57-542(+)
MESKYLPYQVNMKERSQNLRSKLKSIIEEKSMEELDSFVTKYIEELKRFNTLNDPADNKNGVPIHFACKEGEDDISKIRCLIYHGADINKSDRGGRSLIHMACTRNCINIVKYCITKNVDINLKNPVFGSTPLAIAVENGHLELSKYLLENGADFLLVHNK